MTNYLVARGIDEGTQELVRVCQTQGWAGGRECEIMSEIAGNFVKNELVGNQPWDEFVASEIARVGAEELMLQWFPADSKEAQAIRRRYQIKYVDVPVDQTIVKRTLDPKAILLAAGAVAAIIMGAS
jgi:hypothetical protein